MTTHYMRHGVNGDLNFEEINFSTNLILETAKENGIKCKEIPYTGLFLLTYQGKSEYIHAQPPTNNTRTAVYCCKNKAIAKSILSSHKISVPKGFMIKKSDKINYWKSIYKTLNKPVVVKPIDSSLAFNVFANITSEKDYISAIKTIFKHYGKLNQDLLVEEMFIGTEYRILVTDKKILGIMSRVPANVVGDGIHTITQLVELKNTHLWRGGKYALHPIKITNKEVLYLKRNNWRLNDVPSKKQLVQLHEASTTNIDDGGDTIDCTSIAHPSVTKIAINAVRSIPGLRWAGMDFFSKDITKLQSPSDYIVLEINTSPNISWQEFPAIGPRRHIALEYLKTIFPNLKSKVKSKITKSTHRHLENQPLSISNYISVTS